MFRCVLETSPTCNGKFTASQWTHQLPQNNYPTSINRVWRIVLTLWLLTSISKVYALVASLVHCVAMRECNVLSWACKSCISFRLNNTSHLSFLENTSMFLYFGRWPKCRKKTLKIFLKELCGHLFLDMCMFLWIFSARIMEWCAWYVLRTYHVVAPDISQCWGLSRAVLYYSNKYLPHVNIQQVCFFFSRNIRKYVTCAGLTPGWGGVCFQITPMSWHLVFATLTLSDVCFMRLPP